jgi:hypothetical protein
MAYPPLLLVALGFIEQLLRFGRLRIGVDLTLHVLDQALVGSAAVELRGPGDPPSALCRITPS